MSKKTNDIEETLRQAIAASGLSEYRLAKISGVSSPVICRFVNRTRGITLPTAAKLASALNLELTERKQK